MISLSQWIHQNNILLTASFVFLASFICLSWFKLWNRRRAATWFCLLLTASAALFWLRTPSAVLTESNQLESQQQVSRTILEFDSIEEIEAHLAAGDKPTLVEFYSDFGFS